MYGHYWCNEEVDRHYIRQMEFQPNPTDYLDFGIDPATLGQFTGLKDKNGKEIYEGDIVRIPCYKWEGNHYEARQMEVEWHYSGYKFNRTGCAVFWKDCEVIGTIHENPELLEKATEE